MSIKSLFLQSLLGVIFISVSFANIANKNTITAKKEILFTENKGQIVDQYNEKRTDVLFSGKSGDMSFFIKNNGVSYQLYKVDKSNEISDFSKRPINPAQEISVYRIDLNWVNANRNFEIKKGIDKGFSYAYYTSTNTEGIHEVKSYEDFL